MARICAAVALAVALAALTGCARRQPPRVLPPIEVVRTVEVRVPVLTPITPPETLTAPLDITDVDLPVFVLPSDPAASAALTVEGEMRLRWVVEYLLYRLQIWQAWANALQQGRE